MSESTPSLGLPFILAAQAQKHVTHNDALLIIKDAGIDLPIMYSQGFSHNNCIACPKASSKAYWAKIKKHYPDEFARMAALERKLNAAICKRYEKGVRIREFLDELDLDKYLDETPPTIQCGLFCGEV